MADTFRLNLDEVTLGDIEDFEEYTGLPFAVIDQLGSPDQASKLGAKVFTGVALLVLRQDNPDATIEEARKVTIAQLMSSAESDPTPAEPEALTPLRDGSASRPKKNTAA